jgi:hypothetical protein
LESWIFQRAISAILTEVDHPKNDNNFFKEQASRQTSASSRFNVSDISAEYGSRFSLETSATSNILFAN